MVFRLSLFNQASHPTNREGGGTNHESDRLKIENLEKRLEDLEIVKDLRSRPEIWKEIRWLKDLETQVMPNGFNSILMQALNRDPSCPPGPANPSPCPTCPSQAKPALYLHQPSQNREPKPAILPALALPALYLPQPNQNQETKPALPSLAKPNQAALPAPAPTKPNQAALPALPAPAETKPKPSVPYLPQLKPSQAELPYLPQLKPSQTQACPSPGKTKPALALPAPGKTQPALALPSLPSPAEPSPYLPYLLQAQLNRTECLPALC
ncbi:hypothetical protein BY996DRAFT_6426321 [Phakopsora pachyrhizi]|nr:hypothetical protein BY996DRAFT_6426321 [Phakopsora pachyrhizi]